MDEGTELWVVRWTGPTTALAAYSFAYFLTFIVSSYDCKKINEKAVGMNEVEILSEMTTHGDRIWSIMQYWTSVCFGILVAAHLTAGRVGLLVISIFLAVFSLFTLQLIGMMAYDMDAIRAGADQLSRLRDDGQKLGPISRHVLSSSPAVSNDLYNNILRYSWLPAMFIATITYPLYGYFKHRSD